jgi:hypothetical protein
MTNSDKHKKEDKWVIIDGTLRIAKTVFIILLLSPFAYYITTKVDFSKTETIKVVTNEDTIVVKDVIDVGSGLIVDEGYETVKGTCGACHSLDIVVQNKATRQGWKDIIVWMQETQKLWDLGENEVVILDYLEKNYAPEQSGRRKPLANIEWYDL